MSEELLVELKAAFAPAAMDTSVICGGCREEWKLFSHVAACPSEVR